MKKIFLLIIGILLVTTFIVAETNYCCEKTVEGAWCQDSSEENCNDDYRAVPTSCEATAYCKKGTCVDSEEGTCMDNTPQKVCDENNGVWYDSSSEDVPQCNLGCCLIGQQAAFVTKTRCKRLSAIYGLETNFRDDIGSEVQCIATAKSDVLGACVFEQEYERTCSIITQEECSEISGNTTTFYEGRLCSDEKLNTNCGPSEKTTCVEGKDGVYFVDTCGNVANIYDASKINDKEYWTNMYDTSESCDYGKSNADSRGCGNCDYYLGSTCKTYKRSEDKSKPVYGDYICRDLSCEWDGEKYEHGETWCANSEGTEDNLPGSRYFRLVCYNGDVTIEPCSDFRAEVCIQDDIDGFSVAACRVNKWQSCVGQTNQKDCENEDKMDCQWISNRDYNVCVPKYAPGFDFWKSEGEAEEICSQASVTCNITYEEGLIGDRECISGCECISSSWEKNLNKLCVSLGDCGSSTNYLGYKGYHSDKATYSGTNSSS